MPSGDEHITDPGTGIGPAIVKITIFREVITMMGDVKTARTNGINSTTVQTEEISFNNNNDYKLVATLTRLQVLHRKSLPKFLQEQL